MFIIKAITDQHITKGAESLHADLAPLVCEEDIFQPFVNHRVHFLQPWRKNTEQDTMVNSRQTCERGWWEGALIMCWWINKWERIVAIGGRETFKSGPGCSLVTLSAASMWDKWTLMDTSAFMWKQLNHYCTTKHSPDNVQVCVSITHIQPQQVSDVVRWRGRTHVPSDDVHPVGKRCYVI